MNNRQLFNVSSLGDGIWSIAGSANEQMYLVTGSKKAMLVDTGMGIGDLAGIVRELTNLPFMVVDTHGHPDHAGGNSNFCEIWLPEKDLEIMEVMCATEYRFNDIAAVNKDTNPLYPQMVEGLVPLKAFDRKYLQPDQVIDLGGRQFTVLETPGHTPGSLCLVNFQEQLIFPGDTIVATPVWIYLKHSLPLHVYYQSLQKIDQLGFTHMKIFPGHPPVPLGFDHLKDLIACCEEILGNPRRGTFTTTFAGEGLQWTHGKGTIIYDPDKL
jgi:glyoxylase-like metal-dependent hydrolase (beta-lactamase superfamily II)